MNSIFFAKARAVIENNAPKKTEFQQFIDYKKSFEN